MWKRLTLLFGLAILTACEPVNSTPDLYMAAKYSQATADAAQYESKYLGDQLTATAEAPIIHITQTAAGLIVQGTQTQAAIIIGQTQTQAAIISAQNTQSAQATGTAMAWTPTPNATATLGAAQLMAQQTAISNNTERDKLQLERQNYMNKFYAALPGLIFMVVLSVLAIGTFMLVRQQSFRSVPRDARGDAVPMLNIIDGTYSDVDKAFYPQIGIKREDVKALPAVTADDQKPVTERQQLLHLATNGLPGTDLKPRKQFVTQQITSLSAGSEIRNRFAILHSEEQPPVDLIDAEAVKVLENDWKEGQQ